MHHHGGAVLQRPQQVRGGKCVVDDQGDAVPAAQFRDGRDVEHVVVRVRNRFGEERRRLRAARRIPRVQIARVLDHVAPDSQASQALLQEPPRALVDVRGHNDVVPGARDRQQCRGGRRLTGREQHRPSPRLQIRDAPLHDVDGRIPDPRVPEAGSVLEVGCRLVPVLEPESGGQVDRQRARRRGGGLATGVHLPGGEPGARRRLRVTRHLASRLPDHSASHAGGFAAALAQHGVIEGTPWPAAAVIP
jgi:hypothetical protein